MALHALGVTDSEAGLAYLAFGMVIRAGVARQSGLAPHAHPTSIRPVILLAYLTSMRGSRVTDQASTTGTRYTDYPTSIVPDCAYKTGAITSTLLAVIETWDTDPTGREVAHPASGAVTGGDRTLAAVTGAGCANAAYFPIPGNTLMACIYISRTVVAVIIHTQLTLAPICPVPTRARITIPGITPTRYTVFEPACDARMGQAHPETLVAGVADVLVVGAD